jgi:hypothetical protein
VVINGSWGGRGPDFGVGMPSATAEAFCVLACGLDFALVAAFDFVDEAPEPLRLRALGS